MPNIARKTLLKERNDIMKYVAELEIQLSNVVCDDPVSMARKTHHSTTTWMNERQFRITSSRCYALFI
jgi:hypothetical protein